MSGTTGIGMATPGSHVAFAENFDNLMFQILSPVKFKTDSPEITKMLPIMQQRHLFSIER